MVLSLAVVTGLSNINKNAFPVILELNHCGRVMHICVVKLNIIGFDYGLTPGRRRAIIGTNAGILLIGPLGTNFIEILNEIYTFSFKKMRMKMSSGKWRLFFSRPQCVKYQAGNQEGDTHVHKIDSQWKITSLWRQNDVATSFWRHNDVIIASCARWELIFAQTDRMLQLELYVIQAWYRYGCVVC